MSKTFLVFIVNLWQQLGNIQKVEKAYLDIKFTWHQQKYPILFDYFVKIEWINKADNNTSKLIIAVVVLKTLSAITFYWCLSQAMQYSDVTIMTFKQRPEVF